jgi:hypothetical protein
MEQQLHFLMNHPGYYIIINTVNYENVRIKYKIVHYQNDDFLITSESENHEEDYTAETDLENLIEDFQNWNILNTKMYNSNEIEVDYTRKIPKKIDECPICLDKLIINICANRSCRHLYHCDCIIKWKGGTCPVCRKELDLYKLQDIEDYRKTAGFLSFGSINSDIKYLLRR